MKRAILGLALVVGCGAPEQDEVHAPPSLHVWVEASDYFTPADVMAGCAAWSVVGVSCALATEAEADTWVRSYEEAEDHAAWGGTDGRVDVNVAKGNHRGTPLLAVILAHEIGHRMGLGHLADNEIGMMSAEPKMSEPRLTVADLREWEATR